LPQPLLARWWLPGIVVLAGLSGVTTIWVAVAVLSNRSCGWFALLAAVDMVLMLQLSRAPAGTARGIVAMIGTALAISLSLWMIAATQLGFVFGLGPVASALRLGPVLAWELTRLNMHTSDWIFVALSLPLAVWWGGGKSENR
jgi:hypothetical protein